MKSLVIYYSMSGNTKKIAEAIRAGIISTGEQCDIAKIKDVKTQDLTNYDLIGLGSPVINNKELSNVSNFIQNTMKFVDRKHAFAFCTHGAVPGYYLARVVPALIQRGLTVIGWNDWFCSVVYPATPKPYFTDGHPDIIDIKEAEDFGKEMVERSGRIRGGENRLIPILPKGTEYDKLYMPIMVPPTDKDLAEYFKVFLEAESRIELKLNREKCKYPKCTLCIDNCPTGSIDFSISPPTFHKTICERCWHCEQTCPNGAIEVNWEFFQKAHDPLTVALLQRSLEIFEARGRFRRLVPLKDIGWNTSLCKSKKPPRYKPA
jgi:menaquinone-dependent protoporphyrinogen IX oxidase/NAD-dependent dihydropyrimidine dehydrogenase PreA subunit